MVNYTNIRQGEVNDRDTIKCADCLYMSRDEDSKIDHCLRFARFVDHVINDSSKDCNYGYPSN
ncbi:MAG: hypothetical protein CSYNP_02698 [Syntrophus sp. SKADARSKE-3]|nr:hypothetical protein [Syntrophus sp. SKADARSKE-3]